MVLHHTSLFSGIGGFELGIPANSDIRTTQFVEKDSDAIAVLQHHFPSIPIHTKICTYHPKEKGGIYTIGFPCTGTSSAGTKSGLNHIESALWWEALRCIKEGKPEFIIIENPTGLIHNGLRTVLGSLRMAGYNFDAPAIIHADALGSPQKRARLFVIAYPNDAHEHHKKAPPWHQQIRAKLEIAQRRKAESRCLSVDDGIPAWMGGKCVDANWGELPKWEMQSHTPKRREAITLYARAVCPSQARLSLIHISEPTRPEE
jgi:DNA (cytosine-5)-methyltransferase 1